MVINFFLNGYHYCSYRYLTLEELLDYFAFSDKVFIVEYNDKLCNQTCWRKQIIKDDDKIEVISIVGGG